MNYYSVVRHGESENNRLGIECSALHNKHLYGLTEEGRSTATVEAEAHPSFDLVISSPLRRALETAIIFGETSRCLVEQHDLLREIYVGDFELQSYETTDEFVRNNPCDSIPYPNGESIEDVRQRVLHFMQWIDQTYVHQHILLVTHGHVVLLLQEYFDPSFDRQRALREYDDAESRKVIQLNCP